MFKQAWRSYIASLHPRNLKKKRTEMSMFWSIYFLFYGPLNAMMNHDEDWIEKLILWSMILMPIGLMLWSNMVTKLSLPKAMFLTPITLEEKKKYIYGLMIFKIGVPVVVHILLHIIYLALSGIRDSFDIVNIIISAFAVTSFGIGMYVCSEMRSKFDRYIRYAVRGKDGAGKDAWLNWICMVVSFFAILFFSGVEVVGEEPFDIWDMGIEVLMGILPLMILCIAIIKTRYQQTIENISDYEVQFDVLGKVKNKERP